MLRVRLRKRLDGFFVDLELGWCAVEQLCELITHQEFGLVHLLDGAKEEEENRTLLDALDLTVAAEAGLLVARRFPVEPRWELFEVTVRDAPSLAWRSAQV